MILSDGKTDGFIQTTLDYIAGNKFLGFLTTEWKKKHPKEEPLNSPEFRALFLDGAVSFGNATLDFEGRQCVPMPLCFRNGQDGVENLLTCGLGKKVGETLGGYLEPLSKNVVHPRFLQSIHLKIDGHSGDSRPYGYETMDKGTSFAEMIICQDAYLKILKDLFADCESFQMGRSRSSGYGTVRLTKLEEVNLPEQFVLAPGTHTFFLPSPFIPEKSWESPLKGFLAELSKYLGEVELVPEQVFCALTRADGYNNYWDMPRCTRIGLAAGSVITVVTKQKGNLPLALGQSLPEGYGRFLVDLPLLKEEKPVLTIGEQPSSATSGQSEAMVPGKLLQVWRKRSMERLAKEEAFDCVWNSTVFEEFLLSLRSYNRPSANQRSNFQRLIMGQDQKAWIPAFREILSKQPGRQWKTVRPADPFSTLNRRGNLDEIMLKLLDAEGTDALVSKLYAPFQTLPELPGAPMTPEEQASYRLARHKLLLIELLRRWEKENHAWEGGK